MVLVVVEVLVLVVLEVLVVVCEVVFDFVCLSECVEVLCDLVW